MGKHVCDDTTASATMRCAELVSSGDITGAEAVMRGEYERGFDEGVEIGIDVERGLIDRPVPTSSSAPALPAAFDEDPEPDSTPSGIHEINSGVIASTVRAYR